MNISPGIMVDGERTLPNSIEYGLSENQSEVWQRIADYLNVIKLYRPNLKINIETYNYKSPFIYLTFVVLDPLQALRGEKVYKSSIHFKDELISTVGLHQYRLCFYHIDEGKVQVEARYIRNGSGWAFYEKPIDYKGVGVL